MAEQEKSYEDFSAAREESRPDFLELEEIEKQSDALELKLKALESQRNEMLAKWKEEKRTDPMPGYRYISEQIFKIEAEIFDLIKSAKPIIERVNKLKEGHTAQRLMLKYFDPVKKPKN